MYFFSFAPKVNTDGVVVGARAVVASSTTAVAVVVRSTGAAEFSAAAMPTVAPPDV